MDNTLTSSDSIAGAADPSADEATGTVVSETVSAPRPLDQIQADVANAVRTKDDISAREEALKVEKEANANLLASLIAEGRASLELARAESKSVLDAAEADLSDVEAAIKGVVAKVATEAKTVMGEIEAKVGQVVQAVEDTVTGNGGTIVPPVGSGDLGSAAAPGGTQ